MVVVVIIIIRRRIIFFCAVVVIKVILKKEGEGKRDSDVAFLLEIFRNRFPHNLNFNSQKKRKNDGKGENKVLFRIG